MTREERALHIAKEFGATKANKEKSIYRACIRMAEEQKAIDKENAHKAFVELLMVQYGEECDESMHMYIDDALKKAMED